VSAWNTTFPPILSELNGLEFGEIDFEPYEAFLSSEETADWFAAWTGNAAAMGAELRVFGQDGTGGYAAFWLVAPGTDLLKQPVAFFGSEGERGVVAIDFDHYLWLLAAGIGPYEAVAYRGELGSRNDSFESFAQKNSSVRQLSPKQILAEAERTYPGLEPWVKSLIR
jgi:hypothetical protein